MLIYNEWACQNKTGRLTCWTCELFIAGLPLAAAPPGAAVGAAPDAAPDVDGPAAAVPEVLGAGVVVPCWLASCSYKVMMSIIKPVSSKLYKLAYVPIQGSHRN